MYNLETATLSSISCRHDPYFNIMEICSFCNNEICSSCRIIDHNKTSSLTEEVQIEKYQCKICTISQELKIMSDAILSATKSIQNLENFEINIINIMASYSVGFIVKCCNTDKQCQNEISISNRFDLQHPLLKIDSDNNKILNVPYDGDKGQIMKKQNKKHNKTRKMKKIGYVNVYGQKRKIFCKECNGSLCKSKNKITPKTTTPFMMMMNTKRFQKNHFGNYQLV